jgi:hypothetical protein
VGEFAARALAAVRRHPWDRRVGAVRWHSRQRRRVVLATPTERARLALEPEVHMENDTAGSQQRGVGFGDCLAHGTSRAEGPIR